MMTSDEQKHSTQNTDAFHKKMNTPLPTFTSSIRELNYGNGVMLCDDPQKKMPDVDQIKIVIGFTLMLFSALVMAAGHYFGFILLLIGFAFFWRPIVINQLVNRQTINVELNGGKLFVRKSIGPEKGKEIKISEIRSIESNASGVYVKLNIRKIKIISTYDENHANDWKRALINLTKINEIKTS